MVCMRRNSPAIEPKRNKALHQVRMAVGATQSQFARTIGVSTAYVQAMELGVRDVSGEIAEEIAVMTGAWPPCLTESWTEAVDFDGAYFTSDTYLQYTSVEQAEWNSLKLPSVQMESTRALELLLQSAAEAGKGQIFAHLLKSRLEGIAKTLDLNERIAEVWARRNRPKTQVTVGQLRSAPELAALLLPTSDHHLSDEEIVEIERVDNTQPDLFPSYCFPTKHRIKAKFIMRNERNPEIQAEYQSRAYKLGEQEAALLKKNLA